MNLEGISSENTIVTWPHRSLGRTTHSIQQMANTEYPTYILHAMATQLDLRLAGQSSATSSASNSSPIVVTHIDDRIPLTRLTAGRVNYREPVKSK